MTVRPVLRHPVTLALAGVGIAAAVLVYVPALISALPVRLVIGEAVILPTHGCLHRVSTRGIVHAPDSPHWAQTGTTRCLDTE